MERVLGVVIGLGATYLLFSVIVVAIVEGIAGRRRMRATQLRAVLQAILNDAAPAPATGEDGKPPKPAPSPLSGLAQKVFAHPLIATLGKAASGNEPDPFPSYVPTPLFARAFLDAVGEIRKEGKEANKAYQEVLENLPAETKTYVKGIVGSAITSIEVAEQRVGEWFDASMDRLSGAYRRHVSQVKLLVTIFAVVLVNADTITIGATFWRDSSARSAAVQLAAAEVKACTDDAIAAVPDPGTPTQPSTEQSDETDPQTTQAAIEDRCTRVLPTTAQGVPLPLGWTWKGIEDLDSGWNTLMKILGLALTVIAVSLGAPFWFDLLRRVAPAVASSGPKPSPQSNASSTTTQITTTQTGKT